MLLPMVSRPLLNDFSALMPEVSVPMSAIMLERVDG
jgi:hypothetical protein